jgi:Ni/Co efflux regulator RcnB
MNRLCCAVAAIALIAPAAALAQPQNNRHENNRPENNRAESNRHENNRTQEAHQNRANAGHAYRGSNRHQSTRAEAHYRIGHRPATYHRIRASAFHYPRGYRYRRWSAGTVLPHLFLTTAYFFNDWGALGLGPPPPGYVWIRYGPDLLLVNRYSGRVADVIYGAFY